jgi:hypothetical protein
VFRAVDATALLIYDLMCVVLIFITSLSNNILRPW